MSSGRHPGLADYGMLCLLAVIWGGSFMLTRVAVAELPPITLTAIRQGIAVVILAAVAIRSGQALNASRSDHAVIVASAFFGLALPFGLISWGLQEITAGLSAILMGLMPLMTIVLAHFFTQDEKMNLAKLLGVFLGIGGLVVLFWPDIFDRTDADIWRQLAIMGAGVSYAVNALITKRLLHLKPRPMFAINIAWSLVMLAPVALLFEPLPSANPSAAAWFSLVLLGIFPTAAASLLMFRIIGRQGASFFGQINLLVPVAGVLWGAAILGERLSLNAFVALAIILSGVAVARLHPKPKFQTVEEKTS
ncbi:DMT family transporter [Nitratireductor sp. XY-223]|uniref:DMT family transporter n=1 Tax=Nitratireductor sp. XY-223 TaxID=2561926 RepID=UPI0010A9D1F3|nr:DMT family transporter [Nitratireductor sp. XY-223]